MYGRKQLFIRFIFLMEIGLFVYGYGWGRHGIVSLYACKQANEQLSQQVVSERQLLKEVENQVVAWNNDPFYKEQYAREQLHMARPEEIVYF